MKNILLIFIALTIQVSGIEAASIKTVCKNAFSYLGYHAAGLALSTRYKVSIQGLDKIEAKGNKGILFLSDHPGMIEPVLDLHTLWPKFRPRGIGSDSWMKLPILRTISEKNRALGIPSEKRSADSVGKIKKLFNDVAEGLKNGDNFLLYPSGQRKYENEEKLGHNSSVFRIRELFPDARLVTIRNLGLWGSIFSRSGGFIEGPGQDFQYKKIAKHVVYSLLQNGIVLTPKRPVTLMLEELNLPKELDKKELNLAIENALNGVGTDVVAPDPVYYPHTIWEKIGLSNGAGRFWRREK